MTRSRSAGRPAHPDKHDRRIVDLLEKSLHGEVLIPCQDEAAMRLFRSRIREIIRAHKVWETGRATEFSHVNTKQAPTLRVQAMRPGYLADPDKMPITLIVDGREKLTEMLEAAAVTTTPFPVVGPVHLARSDEEEEERVEDESDEFDPYLQLTQRYARRTT